MLRLASIIKQYTAIIKGDRIRLDGWAEDSWDEHVAAACNRSVATWRHAAVASGDPAGCQLRCGRYR